MPRPEGRINEGEPAGSSDDLVTGAHEATQLSKPEAAADVTPLPIDDATRLSGGDGPASRGDETRLGTGDETRLHPGDETRFADADATRLGTGDARRFGDADATRLIDADDADATRLGEPDLTVLGPAGDDPTGIRPGDGDLTSPFTGDSRPSPGAGSGVRPPTGGGTRRARTSSGLRGGKGSAQGPIEVGQAFGDRYHIIRVLGVGGMGAVYQAWDAELGVAVALKVIRPEITADPAAASDIERRFKRELLLARQVTHKNVVRIHDLGDIDGIKYITMPFVDGADLATILTRDTKLPVPRALRIARGIVSGLVAAHHAGVVHRDLKPANIMVGTDDVPTIMDFGIARSAGGPGQARPPIAGVAPADLSRAAALAATGTVAGTIVGTVAYMAPEQAKGQEVDQRADIYALGLILYDMLIGGRRAERAASAVAELQERMEHAPPAPRTIDAEIPEAVDAIVRRCLEPDPNKRFQTTVELETALGRLDDNGKPLPIIRRLTRRTMIAAAAAVVLLLGGTFYVTKWLSAPVKPPDPVSVVIADVRNSTDDPTFDNTIEQTLRRALEDATFVSAFDRTRIPALGVRAPDKLDEVAARELAVKQGLGVVLAGSIERSGSGYAISLKALQTVTGNVIADLRSVASDKNRVLETATRLAATVRRRLGDRKSESDQLFDMRSVSASSLEVVSLYAAAVEAQAKGQYEEARQSYLQAVALDPNFGLGYQGLAAMSRNLGRTEDAEKYINEAIRHVAGLTQREQLTTRGFYYTIIGDNKKCVEEYEQLLLRYPVDIVAHNQRAICLTRLRRMRDAVKEIQETVALVPKHVGLRTNLALAANLAGDFQMAEAEVKAMPQPDGRALLALAYSQVGRGLVAEAAESYKKIAPMGPRFASVASAGLADLLVYEGRFAEAIRSLEEGAAADLAASNPLKAAIKYTSIAYTELMRDRKSEAVAAAETALRHSNAMPVRFLAGRALAEADGLDRARTLAAGLSSASDVSGESQAHGRILEGEIALKSKNPQEAIKILTSANTMLDTWLGHFALGRAYLEAGAYVQADSEFDRCLARRGEVLSVMEEGPTYGLFPIVYYYQGRAREELKIVGFADSYREYLRIRGASAEDPLVRTIRRRVAD